MTPRDRLITDALASLDRGQVFAAGVPPSRLLIELWIKLAYDQGARDERERIATDGRLESGAGGHDGRPAPSVSG